MGADKISGQRNVVPIGDGKLGRVNGKHPGVVGLVDPHVDISKRINDTLALLSKTRDRFSRLPEAERTALSLVVVDGLSYREAAERLEIDVETLMQRLSRARDTLRKLIASDRQN